MTDLVRLAVVTGVVATAAIGWNAAGIAGMAIGIFSGAALFAARWNRLPLWAWAALRMRSNRCVELNEPLTVTNDCSGGGVRYQDGVAAVAVQILGRRHQPTYLTGSNTTETANALDVADLYRVMRQSLGLTIDSLSVVSFGARRRSAGDYPRLYDTLIGTPPYAGQRETWLVVRIGSRSNADALRFRTTIGTAAVAAAQRIVTALGRNGIRARVATATDIAHLDKRLGHGAIEPRWGSLRSGAGWQTTYAYGPGQLTTEGLAQAWSLRVDGVIQNVTLFPDGTATATLTIRTPQCPDATPTVSLRSLSGEQAKAIAANWCCPLPQLQRTFKDPLRQSVFLPIGSSGVLMGKTPAGDRLLIPLTDPGQQSRIHIRADEAIVKRIVIRAAGSGERITVHTTDLARWESVRMSNIAVIEHPRPADGTTLSVIDGTILPAPRPSAVLSVGTTRESTPQDSDVIIDQVGPADVTVTVADISHGVEVELFRAENRYLTREADLADAAVAKAY